VRRPCGSAQRHRIGSESAAFVPRCESLSHFFPNRIHGGSNIFRGIFQYAAAQKFSSGPINEKDK
jgi:hypothetical protein